MGVEAKPELSHPPIQLTGKGNTRTAYVKLFNALNTIVIPHDPKDTGARRWAAATNNPDTQPARRQTANNEVVYFVDGHETLPQFQCEIEQTTGESDFIYLAGWYLDVNLVFPDYKAADGSTQKGRSMADLLVAAVKRKVQVRILLDGQKHGFSAFAIPQNLEAVDLVRYGPPLPKASPPPQYELIDKGVSRPNPDYSAYWAQYNETHKTQIEARKLREEQYKQGSPDGPDSDGIVDYDFQVSGTHHQKILLVMRSGQLNAFVGGIDINSDRINKVEDGAPEHDVHCRIRGPAAQDVLDIFLDRWDDQIIRLQQKEMLGNDPILERRKHLRGKMIQTQGECGTLSVQIARTAGHIASAPYKFALKGEKSIREMVHTGIRQAQRLIYIEDQYLVNEEVAGWLSLAMGHIQRLIILVPPPRLTTPPGYLVRRREFIDKITQAGGDKVGVFCLNADSETCGTYVHAKTWIFDDRFAIIGSANCNNRGMTHDSEVAAGIFDPSDDHQLTYTLPHRLRMRLWAQHLGMDKAELADGVASAVHWLDFARPNSRVMKYDTATTYLNSAENTAIGGWLEDVGTK